MPLSSSTLIHFTADKESLKGILSDNFKVKYCRETIHWGARDKTVIRIPMVSFCDIPLSQIKNHISNYGHYGIGLTREWAIKNALNPVLYMQPESSLSTSYAQLIRDVVSLGKQTQLDEAVVRRVADIARYSKNYESTLERNGKKFRKYRFSDEREWRYVPPYTQSCKPFYRDKDFDDPTIVQKAIDSVGSLRLKFRPNDVKYIIIKNDREISEFIEHLRRAKGKKYTQNDIERLTTRLFTSDQIHKDI